MIWRYLAAGVFIAGLPAVAQTTTDSERQAQITGEGGQGRCEIEVEVDGAAEVSIRDRMGSIRTLAGRPAIWRRFKCNRPMPRNPGGFQFQGIDGRGQVGLVHDPARGGVAVVRIEDPKNGSEGYTFALLWEDDNGGNYRNDNGGYRGDNGGYRDGGDRPRFDTERVTRQCADAVADRLGRDGYRNIRFLGSNAEDRPGRRDRVTGRVSAQERFGSEEFTFACGMSFQDGSVRSVDVVPR